ncbi:hypothetical protein Gorai_015193 [Gossypium raimondii]|uniref:Bifunctional inhibitor/plant lipid transfer protein/seed storage helical domain-containing protein n=1 Tax=Gossypium raimondii TaxID=29730 RepID=A0A7J8P550_GOSRA|nr:hypothetical protein [Gossypium raimondii]
MVTSAYAQGSCAQNLVSCYPYLNNATAKPEDDCCNPIRQTVAKDLPCLCNLYNDPNTLASFNVTVPEALRISRECGVSTDLSACNGQSGGADRIALTGVITLFLVLVSITLY